MKKKKTLLAVLLAVGVSFCSSTGTMASAGNMETQDLILQEEQGMEYVGARSSKKTVKPAKTTITSVESSNSGKLILRWKKVRGAKGYEIYRKGSGERSYRKIKTIKKGTILRYTDSSVNRGSKYTYKIRCYSVSKGKKVYSAFSHSKSRTVKSKPLYTGNYKRYKDGGRTELYARVYKSGGTFYVEIGRNRTFATTTYKMGKYKGGYYGYASDDSEIYIIPENSSEIYISFETNSDYFWDGYYTK